MPVRVYGRRCCGMQGGSLALINKDMRYLIREKTEREVRLWWYDWPKAYNAVLAEGASPLLLNEGQFTVTLSLEGSQDNSVAHHYI
ncbi:hypothetical protein PV325_000327 [Microctonus aethiopoides]|nr:hypothetical protein PV325_000327 [Microctonus aethiopoides]